MNVPAAKNGFSGRARRSIRFRSTPKQHEPCGVLYAAVASVGRKALGRSAIDLLIAAVARANDLALFTRNPGDFGGLEALVDIVHVDL
jgi:predicted nucleic acid-binding protein